MWDGRESVAHVLELAEELASNPDSRVRADMLGGPQFQGWGVDRHLIADLFDRLSELVVAAFGQKLPERMLYPRPVVATVEPVGTVADFDTNAFLAGRW